MIRNFFELPSFDQAVCSKF